MCDWCVWVCVETCVWQHTAYLHVRYGEQTHTHTRHDRAEVLCFWGVSCKINRIPRTATRALGRFPSSRQPRGEGLNKGYQETEAKAIRQLPGKPILYPRKAPLHQAEGQRTVWLTAGRRNRFATDNTRKGATTTKSDKMFFSPSFHPTKKTNQTRQLTH